MRRRRVLCAPPVAPPYFNSTFHARNALSCSPPAPLLRRLLFSAQATCVTLPIASLLEADAALAMPQGFNNNKSPSRELAGRTSAGGGAGSGGRSSGLLGAGGSPEEMGVGGAMNAAIPQPHRRSRVGASGSRSGGGSSRSGQRPISAEVSAHSHPGGGAHSHPGGGKAEARVPTPRPMRADWRRGGGSHTLCSLLPLLAPCSPAALCSPLLPPSALRLSRLRV